DDKYIRCCNLRDGREDDVGRRDQSSQQGMATHACGSCRPLACESARRKRLDRSSSTAMEIPSAGHLGPAASPFTSSLGNRPALSESLDHHLQVRGRGYANRKEALEPSLSCDRDLRAALRYVDKQGNVRLEQSALLRTAIQKSCRCFRDATFDDSLCFETVLRD